MMISVTEEWRHVEGKLAAFPYEVSSSGNVRRIGNVTQSLIAKHVDHGGYERVSLRMSGRSKNASVHKLVCEAFISLVPDGMTVNHKDGNKRNNRPSNLEVMSLEENIRHSSRVLGVVRCQKLTADSVREIRSLHSSGMTIKLIAARFSVHRDTISEIIRGKTWVHV